ncbi:MAG: peptidoglycan-binding protein [Lewinellaceae bacterium]|nr:peptidoglycan-binding protein [Lewinellaceae bacterium]
MKQILLFILVSCALRLVAQPSGALPGKCYANCYIADQYHTVTEQVMLKPPSTRVMPTKAELKNETIRLEAKPAVNRFDITPAEYDTLEERIEIKPPTRKYSIEPPQYKMVEPQQLVPAESSRLIPMPAVYENISEQILVAPGGKTYTEIPPEYETVQQEYEIEPAYKKVMLHEPKFDVVTEQIEIKPATLKWIRRKGDPNCLQADPEDCFVWCLVEEPAEYQAVSKRVNKGCDGTGQPDAGCVEIVEVPAKMGSLEVQKLKTAARIQEETLEPKYMTLTRKVLRDSAYVREEMLPASDSVLSNKIITRPASAVFQEVPGEYLVVRKLVLKKPATYREIQSEPTYKTVNVKKLAVPQTTKTETTPGEFITVAKRVLVRQGGFSEWREVLCNEKITGYTLKQIQAALKARGYDPGPASTQMGTKTRDSCGSFRLDNDLPVGNLDFETLNALGIRN